MAKPKRKAGPTHPKPKKAEAVTVKLPARLGTLRAPAANLDPGALVLQGGPIPIQLAKAVTSMVLSQTMQGASTLELIVADYTGAFMRSRLLKGGLTMRWDGIDYTMVKTAKGDRAMTLTFEESAVNVLRQYTKPKKALRTKVTRAQFVRSLITEVKQTRIPYRIPEVNVRQPVEGK
jgi:hypothetical protein